MFGKLAQLVGPRIGTAGLRVKGLAPELYLIAGVAAGVSAVVMTARAHKKSEDVFEDVIEDIVEAKIQIEELEDGVVDGEGDLAYTTKEKAVLLAPYYRELATRAVKLYAPGILMGVSSVALVLASHGVLRGRNQALMTTATILQQGFTEYRKRVEAEYGQEAEEGIFYGADSRKTTVLEVGEDGVAKKRKVKKNHISEAPDPLMYSRLFDEVNPNWEPDTEITDYFLRSVQQQMNDKLYLNGYVMLNDVYRALAFSESPEGAVVGWSNSMGGDDYISFGLDADINQREGSSARFLDFNVNGPMWELIGQKA